MTANSDIAGVVRIVLCYEARSLNCGPHSICGSGQGPSFPRFVIGRKMCLEIPGRIHLQAPHLMCSEAVIPTLFINALGGSV